MDTAASIRQVIPNDRARLKEIIDLSFPRFFRFFASHSLDSEEGKVLVSEAQGVVVGFAKLIEFNVGRCKCACILWLAVHPEYRRKAIAAALVKVGIENLKQDGAKSGFCIGAEKKQAFVGNFWQGGLCANGFFGFMAAFQLASF